MDDLKIIFEDNDILVVNKPSGMVVNRSQTFSGITVQDIVKKIGEDAIDPEVIVNPDDSDEISEFSARDGIVHRLDKDTSGVLIIAKNEPSFKRIQAQFKRREVEKEYKAIVLGSLPQEKIEIEAPLGRNPKNRLTMAVVDEGRPALTVAILEKEFQVDETIFSLLSVKPTTGRTHQIRVHLAAVGNPIVCDPIYCTRKQFEFTLQYFTRLMLHALSIKFTHPTTGEKLTFTAELPEEFTKYI